MREIHYIDVDEEIITAVSRLRQSGQNENVFVFPKRALILQSLVNLRLLEREAEKLGKSIIVMTQDETGQRLAAKAGLAVENYRDRQQLDQDSTLQPTSFPTEIERLRETGPAVTRHLGSDSFFGPGMPSRPALAETPPEPAPAAPTRLPVRSRDSLPLTSLNSLRRPEITPPARPVSAFQAPGERKPVPLMPVAPPVASSLQSDQSRGGRLGRFMRQEAVSPTRGDAAISLAGSAYGVQARQAVPPTNRAASDRSHLAWIGGGVVLVVALVALGWYAFFPEAVVTLVPQSAEQVVRLQVNGSTAANPSTGALPVRVWGIEKSVRVTESATGASTASENAKARGTIRIYNDFSKDAQPLVATTRFETSDGKVFRLVQGVVVPGVTGEGDARKRGMIEASVVADQSGANFNVGPSTFTIPGFKGSPKYDKFSAESVQAFTGGGTAGTAGTKAVSPEDKDRAAKKALEQARELILADARAALQDGEVVIDPSVQITLVSDSTSPPLGGSAENFEYEGRYSAKLFMVVEQAVRDRIQAERVTESGVTLVPKRFDIGYAAVLPKYDSGTLDMTLESTVLFQAELDAAKLKGALLGSDEDEIREFLKLHPEIERLQVEFDPQLFISTLPADTDRVTVEVVEAATTEN